MFQEVEELSETQGGFVLSNTDFVGSLFPVFYPFVHFSGFYGAGFNLFSYVCYDISG